MSRSSAMWRKWRRMSSRWSGDGEKSVGDGLVIGSRSSARDSRVLRVWASVT